jgi:DNA-binding NarL/FixJ family response regulator
LFRTIDTSWYRSTQTHLTHPGRAPSNLQERMYMRVLLADHHSKVRWALRTAIKEEPRLVVVGEATDAETLLSQAQVLRPDLILLEWELPGQPVEEVLLTLHALSNRCQVIILSRQSECERAALEAGADAFISKAAAPEEVLSALRALASDEKIV